MTKKEWAIVMKNKTAILLHLVKDLEQYKKFKRVDKKSLNKLLREAKCVNQK